MILSWDNISWNSMEVTLEVRNEWTRINSTIKSKELFIFYKFYRHIRALQLQEEEEQKEKDEIKQKMLNMGGFL